MFWGCLSSSQTGSIYIIEGKITVYMHQNSYYELLHISVHKFDQTQEFVLQRDNTSKHTGKII